MDHDLELERVKLELIKVAAARAEMEFAIKQRQSEIRRLQENIKTQQQKEVELGNKIQTALSSIS